METQQFIRKSFPVDAVQITVENMEEAAKWCDGDIRTTGEGEKFIKVRVHNPLTERQTKGFVGDWVLYAGKGYKVYTQKAFERSFDATAVESDDVINNVFVSSGGGEGYVNPPVFGGGGGGSFSPANPGGTAD